jgi:delta-lactam-biosynthetic de-N-acetylase
MYSQLTPKEIPLPIIPQIPFDGMVPKEITRGDTSKKQIIFTFDGGEGSQSAPAILDVLAKHHVRGTFFLTGIWVTRNPDLVKRMRDEGHEIFNHTYDHPHLPTLDDQQIAKEFEDMNRTVLSLFGSSTKPYFRPPYGDFDHEVLSAAARVGYRAVMWTIDAGDWMESQGYTESDVRERIFSHTSPGAIILMHIGDTITGSILDDVFTTLELQGYKIVSLTQGL